MMDEKDTKRLLRRIKLCLLEHEIQWMREQGLREQWVAWWDDDCPQAEKTYGVKR